MFKNALNKIEDSQIILDKLNQTTDFLEFKTLFNSFLSSSRAITYALQKDGAHIEGFDKWYSAKQDEMKKDELLRFIHNTRTEDFHEGKHALSCSTYVKQLFTDDLDGPKDVPTVFGSEGIYRIVDEGTSKERRIPAKGGEYTITISAKNPPTTHLGNKLQKNDPLTICSAALAYLERLVYEARTIFKRDD